MKKLSPLIVLILAALIWSGYWMMGRGAIVDAFAQAQSDLAQDGMTLTASDLNVKGYPLSFETALTDAVISGEDMSIKPELVQISAKAYRPNVWTLSADAPTRIQMRADSGELWDFFLTGEDMRVEMQSTAAGKLKAVDADMKNLKTLAAPDGALPPIVGLELGTLNLSPSPAPLQNGMSTVFNIRGVKLTDKAAGDLQRAFGNYIGRIEGTGIASGLASLDNDDVQAWKKNGGLSIPDFEMDWGPVSFIGDVNLQMGANGANGVATLGVTDADALIQSFVEAGMLSQSQAMGATFLLMAAPTDAQGRTVLSFPIQDNAITLLGQVLHQF